MTTLDTTAPLRFGRFLLEPSRRLLCLDGEAVSLSSRAFDLLVLLIENRDRVVSKDEIFASVWRGVAVEDNNLAVQMSALRRALADPAGDPQTILTIPGRGYRFVAPVAGSEAEVAAVLERPVVVGEPVVVAEAVPVVAPARRRLWPVMGAAVLMVVVFGWFIRSQLREPVAPRLSIVVLPFRNLSADPQQDYLADAISDDLTTDLSHFPGSVVIARESADVYKGKAVGAEVIGRALRVRYLLEGSLMPEGQVLHVNAQLIDASNGAHFWARRFDVTRDTLGRAQSEIVSQIASALNVTLLEVETARSARERPDNPDAEDLYMKARSLWSGVLTLSTVTKVQSLLEEAIEKNKNFSDALAQLAIVSLGKVRGFDDPDETRDYERAKVVLKQALLIAPNNPLAITATGILASMTDRCSEAKSSFQKALLINPNEIQAHKGLAGCARQLGDMNGMIQEVEKIRQLDPVSPLDSSRQHQIGMGYLLLGEPRKALDWLDRAGAGIVDAPGAETALGWQEWRRIYLVAATWLDGRQEEASRMYKEYNRLWPGRSVWQLSSYDTHALSALPGYRAYLSALAAAGMPFFSSERYDLGVRETSVSQDKADTDPTPTSIPGCKVLYAGELKHMIDAKSDPIVIDFGRGAAVIKGSLWIWDDSFWQTENAVKARISSAVKTSNGRPVVVMGNGPFGWSSYNAAIELVANKVRNVLWFRGGEEAWVAEGFAATDMRSP